MGQLVKALHSYNHDECCRFWQSTNGVHLGASCWHQKKIYSINEKTYLLVTAGLRVGYCESEWGWRNKNCVSNDNCWELRYQPPLPADQVKPMVEFDYEGGVPSVCELIFMNSLFLHTSSLSS
jgi:hypothetical protein